MDLFNLTLINLTLFNISVLNETERTNKKELVTRKNDFHPENFNFKENLNYLKDKGQTNVSFNHEKVKPKWNQLKSRKNKTSQAEDWTNFDVLKSKILSMFTDIFPNVTKFKSLISDRENKFLSKMIYGNHPSQIPQNLNDTSAILSVNRPLQKEWKGKLIEITIKLRFSVFLMASYVQHLMMNYFSIFYLDKLGMKTMMASDKQFSYVFSSQKYTENKTTSDSNPCQTYISFILSSSTGLLRTLKYYVNPTLAILGLWQNFLCIVVLKKDGFSKTSNLNLLSVIVAGSFQQLLSINIAEILEFDSGVDMYELVSAFTCVKKRNLVLQVFKHIFLFLGTWGQYVFSSTFLLITIERFLAVFLPLTFKKYVTRKSMVSCLCIIFLMWLPFAVLKISCLYSLEILLTTVSTQPQYQEMPWVETCYNISTTFALTILLNNLLIGVRCIG
ncbi:G-protein coupled receptor [Biomphalaria glabrata]